LVDQLDGADLDDAMAAQWIESGGFGVDHDFPHDVTKSSLEIFVCNLTFSGAGLADVTVDDVFQRYNNKCGAGGEVLLLQATTGHRARRLPLRPCGGLPSAPSPVPADQQSTAEPDYVFCHRTIGAGHRVLSYADRQNKPRLDYMA
jgi:hypothetical protein